jgi:hypothetical protein
MNGRRRVGYLEGGRHAAQVRTRRRPKCNQYCWVKAKCRGRRAQPYSTSLHGAQTVARRERAQIKESDQRIEEGRRRLERGSGRRERREESDEEEGRKERNDRTGLPSFHVGTTDP